MSLSSDFMISIFILFVLVVSLYSLLSISHTNVYVPSLNYNILVHKANYNSLYVTLNSYSLKHGTNNDYEVDCIISNKVYCKNNELNLTGEAPVYLRRGGGN
jgi:hypothetical protein